MIEVLTTMDVQAILDALDTLTPDELAQVKARIEEKQPATPSSWEVDLDAAITRLREGLSEEDLREIVAAMNAKSTVPPRDDAS